MADYPNYIAEIIPADLLDEMTDNRKESLTDMGIAVMGGSKQALTDNNITQATAIAEAIQDTIIENPFATSQGQVVSSVSENYAARLMREGRPVHVKIEGSAVVQDTKATITVVPTSGTNSVTSGYISYTRRIIISCNQNALVNVEFITGIVNAPATIEFQTYLLAKTKYELVFDGDMYVIPGGSIKVEVTPEANGLAQVSFYGIEVMQGV